MKKIVLNLFIFILILGVSLSISPHEQVEATSVTKTTGTVEVTTGWTNCTTTRLNTSDNSRATTTSTSFTTGFQISDFAFGIPAGSTINGIYILVEYSNSSASYTSYIKSSLSWNDGTNWTADSNTCSLTGTTDDICDMGSDTDTWGRTWTTDELADGTFRVKIQGYTSTGTFYTNRVDYVSVAVYYTSTKANGQACTLGSECTSTYCVDSTCCATSSCAGTCNTCGSASHSGAGTCDYIGSATDPDSECGIIACSGGSPNYYDAWTSNTCYYKANISAADAVCTGTTAACKTAADQCPSSTQGGSSGTTRSTCHTQTGCTGITAGDSSGHVTNDSDTYTDCASYGCSAIVYGWSGNNCTAYASTSHDGNCNGSGACYTTKVDSCTSGGATLASCGSAVCVNSSACAIDTASTTSDTPAEICFTSGNHGCPTGQSCDATGTCANPPDCSSIPITGNYSVAAACAFPDTTGHINGVDAGSGTVNDAKLTIESNGTLTVLSGQTIAIGSLEVATGGTTVIIDTGVLKIGTPLYIPDTDDDGHPDGTVTTQYTASGTNRARRSSTIDTNNSQACPDNTQIGPCQTCADGDIANVASGQDTYGDCPAIDCHTGVTKYYDGWSSDTCYYKADVSADNATCDGAGACKTDAVQCAASTQGVSTGTSKALCHTEGGCTGTTAPDITGHITSGQDTYNDCGAVSCSGYYYGWVSNTCYASADVIAANATCDGAGACKTQAVECAASQGASTGVTRTECKTAVGCTGITAGSTGNVTAGQDTSGDCTGLSCSGYYYGWGGDTCYAMADVSASSHTCNGSGSCYTAANQCPSSTQGSAYVTRTLCHTKTGCSGTTAGNVTGHVTNGADTYSDCAASSTDVWLNSGDNVTCSVVCDARVYNNGNCDGAGSCASVYGTCKSIGTDAGGTNGYAMAEDCVAYGGKTCSLNLSNGGGAFPLCSGIQSKWAYCKCGP